MDFWKCEYNLKHTTFLRNLHSFLKKYIFFILNPNPQPYISATSPQPTDSKIRISRTESQEEQKCEPWSAERKTTRI